MADPPAIGRLVESVVRAVNRPVTVKIRSGPDAEHETAAEVARRAEAAGAAAVEIHARSVEQAYQGGPDWSVIARVKAAVRIPVIGGGDIREAADVRRMLDATGADGVAIARGCLGNPWIFRQARALAGGGGSSPASHAGRAAAGFCCVWSKGSSASTVPRSPCDGSRAQAATSPSFSLIFPPFVRQCNR